MKKLNTTPISGMQELLPTPQALFNQLKTNIATVFSMHGFLNIETPAIERSEILLAKAGGDTEKQIYRVFKTVETADSADQALRFDQTVPLARYIVEHENDLAFPFKVSQIGRSYRGERAQKGRFREFYQCDIDVVGRGQLPLHYDVEVIATLFAALLSLNCLPDFCVRISNRKLLTGLLEELNLTHQSAAIFSIVDHAEKVPRENTISSLEALGLGSDNVVKITTFIDIKGDRETAISKLRSFNFENPTWLEGLTELDTILANLEQRLPVGCFQADLLIVRGLDYYTGTVFETTLKDYPELGSICSGGRYDNLASHYTDQILPGVGGSIGLTRLFDLLLSHNLLTEQTDPPVDVTIIPFSIDNAPAAEKFATKLRTEGQIADVLYSDKRLGDRINLAAKTSKSICIIGDDEVASSTAQLKDLTTGEQTPVSL